MHCPSMENRRHHRPGQQAHRPGVGYRELAWAAALRLKPQACFSQGWHGKMTSMNSSAKHFLCFFGTLLATAPAPRAFAQAAEEQAVLAPIHAMFEGMSRRDAAAIKAPTLPGGTMVLMRNGVPAQMTFDDFARRVGAPGPTRIEERIHNPLVRIDHDLAVVWAPFDFLVDGKVDHCGTDLFNLVRVEGKWTIASVADTGTKTCPAN